MNKKIIKTIVITSIYIILCIIFSFISFRPIQLRLSKLLCLLTIENPIYLIGIGFRCFISDLLLSPFGIVDAIFGTLASIVGCLIGYVFRKIKIKNFPFISTISISLVNAIIILFVTSYALPNKYIMLYSFIKIFISEILILIVIGFPIYNKLIEIE